MVITMGDLEHEMKAVTASHQDRVSQQVDGILRALNPKGRYQALHVLVLLLSTIVAVKAVPHRCANPPQNANLTELLGYSKNLTLVQEECKLVVKDNSSVLDSQTCPFGVEYELPEDASIVSQFDLVCDMDWLARLTQTFVILGQGIGAAFTTFLSDRFGRKTVIVTSNFGLLLCGIGAAFAPNPIVFIAFKFAIGVCQQGVVSVTTPYFLELFPTEHRALQAWLVGSTWGFGVMLLSPVAFIFKNSSWRALQTAISLVSLLAIIQFWFTAALSFFTIYLTATSLSGDPYLNFGLTAIMELPSNVFFLFYLNRLGRKRCMQVVYGVVGSGVLLAGFSKSLEQTNSGFAWLTLLASLFAMCGASGCFGIVFSFTPEMFPTNLRSQAVGLSSLMSRFGGMLGPFAGLLAKQAVWAPGVVIGVCAGIVCVLAQVLPETSTRELPQTLPELQAWFKNKMQASNGDIEKVTCRA